MSFNSGALNLSLSKNEGTSWQYQELMDINGDRYPDMISYTSDEGGSTGFSVIEGNGQGFDGIQYYSSPVRHLSFSENLTYGFGASPGSYSAGIVQEMSTSGTVKTTRIETPDESSGGVSFSGFNGTAGASYKTQDFIDITGDGLPDHIHRGGSGLYNVAINKGDNSFAELVSFGSGIDEPLYSGSENASGLSDTAKGISFSNSGSLGTGGAISIVSVGFNASANRTLSRLMDINGDGLSDQV
ncbi:MAG: hypothetical protein KAR21_27350, partial [Spirochaetales bacterium]|nr:hypothetical protein [Spirochaetales bacterium]